MPIRTNTNPRPLELTPELQDILMRNGMQAHVVAGSNGFALMVQGHDSPVLQYPITDKQLKALTDWGTNSANRKAYNTFASIVAADFDMPKDFVHARNANGRVAMGLHGYRTGVGEYGRTAPHHGIMPHMMGHGFLGWTPRQQEGFHLRRIGGQLYYPGAPMAASRPDGRMKPGELTAGGYGFYYKGYTTAPVATNQQEVLAQLQTVITPINRPQRPTTPAIPYKEAIISDVYFSNEKWQMVLASHGIVIDAGKKLVTIQSSAVQADLQYTLTDEQLKALTSDSIKDYPIGKRLEVLNGVLQDDFATPITREMLDSDKLIDTKLHPEQEQELNERLHGQEQYYQGAPLSDEQEVSVQREATLRDNLPKGGVVMDGNDLSLISGNKGWFREGRHGREVTVDDIRVEPVQREGETRYRMTAVIDGEVVSHEISQKQYDKFMALDDYHRMKLFAKVFPEVDMKNRYTVGFGTKLTAALCATAVVAHDLAHGPRMMPGVYVEGHGGPAPRVYHKPGVDTPADVAARQFEAAVNGNPPDHHRGPGIGI